MPNKFLTPDIIAKEALMVLQNELIMANLVHRDYSKEFAKVGDTITVRKPAEFVSKNFNGEIEIQDASEGSVPVTLDRYQDVSFEVSSAELTLDIQSFSEQLLQPAMQALAQKVDEDIIVTGVQGAGTEVKSNAEPTDLKDIADIGKALDFNKVPQAMRRLVLNPEHKYKYALTDNLSKVAYAGTGETLRNAELGRIYSLDTYMDQNAPYSLADEAGTVATLKLTGTKNATTATISGATAGSSTLKKGDGLIIDGQMYRVTDASVSISGGNGTVNLNRKLHKNITTETPVYVVTKHNSLAFHKNAIAFVDRPLELPMGNARSSIQSYNGLSVRVVIDYDIKTKKDICSIDILYGVKVLDAKLAVRLVG